MIRPIPTILAVIFAFAGSGPNTVRWTPDPLSDGKTLVYIPNGLDCQRHGDTESYNCWTSGTTPPAGEVLPHGTVFSGPAYHAAPPTDAAPLPRHVREALGDVGRTLRAAAASADVARQTGHKQAMTEANVKLDVARTQMAAAMKEASNANDR